MIRVELLHGHGRQLPAWLGPALFALVLSGGLFALNELYPFGQLLGGSSAAPEAALWQERQSAAEAWRDAQQEAPAAVPPADQAVAAVPGAQAGQPVAPSVAVPVAAPPPMASAPGATQAVGARQAPRRSAACQWAVRINEQVPPGVQLVSLTCSAAGEYGLEGTCTSEQSLRGFHDQLQQLPSQVSLASWREGKTSAQALRFAFEGRFAATPSRELATLSKDQADRLFGKVAHWADESGLDGLSIKKTITMPLPPARVHQRQKLWGTGSYQQISTFLHRLQQVEEIASLGEVVLMPVQTGERGWVEARLYAAVDVVVGMP
ncbi:MAG: hypothetical protein QGH25_15855 [Candidatus Latescibacteria bacterium]|jgi:hypothetical protein|nr:hypothetical protein [Candidatus Latescibacterota bacterium]